MRRIAVLCVAGLAACDGVRKDNPLDPESGSFKPPVAVAEVLPAGAGTVVVSQGDPSWLDVAVRAVPNPGWLFHRWVGRAATGVSSPSVSVRADRPGDTLRMQAMFLPDWSLTDSVLVDDFDAPDPISSTGRHNSDLLSTLQDAGRPYGSGGWYANGAETVRYYPEGLKQREAADGDWRNTRAAGAGWNGGTCQHLSVRMNRSWANIGVYLKPWYNAVDLSKLRSVRFWARGTGRINVGFVTMRGMENGDYAPLVSAAIPLTATWVRHDIDPSTMRAPAWSSLAGNGGTWDEHRTSLGVLQFEMVTDSVDLWLDDVWLVGVPFSGFL